MAGSSLSDVVTGDETAKSGIGRHFRSGNRCSLYGRDGTGPVCDRGPLGRRRFRDRGFRNRSFGGFAFFGGRRIEDAVRDRSERRL